MSCLRFCVVGDGPIAGRPLTHTHTHRSTTLYHYNVPTYSTLYDCFNFNRDHHLRKQRRRSTTLMTPQPGYTYPPSPPRANPADGKAALLRSDIRAAIASRREHLFEITTYCRAAETIRVAIRQLLYATGQRAVWRLRLHAGGVLLMPTEGTNGPGGLTESQRASAGLIDPTRLSLATVNEDVLTAARTLIEHRAVSAVEVPMAYAEMQRDYPAALTAEGWSPHDFGDRTVFF